MAAAGNDRSFHVCSPYAQQKYSNISCFWEKQPSGCLRISCAFHHSKPRSINGLFLPPSNNAPLQQGVQEGILHPAHGQESLRNQKNILRPIHPPLTIHLNDEDDDEDDDEEEENGAPDWVPQTAADLEEERAIKEICYQSGEYYGIQYPQEHQSTKTVSSPRENELLPWEATERDLQAGDGDTVPTTFKNAKGEGESSGTTVPAETIPRTDRGSFENGGTNRMERVKNYPGKEAKEKQWISEGESKSHNTGTGKGIHTPDPKAKPRRQQRGQSKDDEAASAIPPVRETGRDTYFSSSEPRRSAYVVYRTATVTQEPKCSGPTGDGDTVPTTFKNAKGEGESSGTTVPAETIPRTDRGSFENGGTNRMERVKNYPGKEAKEKQWISEGESKSHNTGTGKGIHTPDPKAKPRRQQRGQSKDDEAASAIPPVRETGRDTYFSSSEPRRSAYVVYRTATVTQEPKCNGPTAVPEPYAGKRSKQKNQLDANRRFWTQTESYDKYTSGSYNAPTWRKRNPHPKTFSKSKTTSQSQEDREVNRKGERYIDRRKR
ncbi:uncharacterized protein C12orf50 homolog [Grus americana]|uniref:uncharacterized protein C12orf50 homolog n=1 Tax=Grus americana TaxID=9117 RepID=UPI002407E782|nr:uncharacterized protein C12orf50 homolog [Grus americana]